MKLVGFTKINKYKKFNYIPVFYNPEKEEFDNRVKDLKKKYNNDTNAKSERQLKSSIKGYMFSSVYATEKHSFVRFIIMLGSIALAFLIVILLLKALASAGLDIF